MFIMDMMFSAFLIPQTLAYCIILLATVDIAFGKWLKLLQMIWVFFAFCLEYHILPGGSIMLDKVLILSAMMIPVYVES